MYASRNTLNQAFNITTEKDGNYSFTDRPLTKSNNDEILLETQVIGKLIHINKNFAALEVPGYRDPGNVLITNVFEKIIYKIYSTHI